MKKLDFGFKMFITLFILCIAGVVFSTIAIDKQIDSYIEQIQMEVHVINNTEDNVTIEKENNKMIININPTEENEEVTNENNETDEYGIVTSISGLNVIIILLASFSIVTLSSVLFTTCTSICICSIYESICLSIAIVENTIPATHKTNRFIYRTNTNGSTCNK